MSKNVIIASENPVKIEATRKAFQRFFPNQNFMFDGVSVSSEVSDQPMTHEETQKGARNRAENARKRFPKADYWVGIEGGIHDDDFGMQAFAWIVVFSKDQQSQAQTGVFYLPAPLAEMVRKGIELGEADDIYFNRKNSKQKDGAVGILTQGEVDRTSYYEQALILALIPFNIDSSTQKK